MVQAYTKYDCSSSCSTWEMNFNIWVEVGLTQMLTDEQTNERTGGNLDPYIAPC